MRRIICQELPTRRFGVELELSANLSKRTIGDFIKSYERWSKVGKAVKITPGIEGWCQSVQNDYWHVKFDRTCGVIGKHADHGWEIASYIGSGHIDIHHIAKLADFLRVGGAQTNANCGLHIHVEVNDFDAEQMGVLLGRWLKVEQILIDICQSQRKNNAYCLPLRRTYDFMSEMTGIAESGVDLWEKIRPRDLSIHNNVEKRVTLNTVGFATALYDSLYTRNTVELRLPECRLEGDHILNWNRLIVNFVETSSLAETLPDDLSPSNSLAEILMYLGLGIANDFLILDRELYDTKVWFLQKIIDCHWDSSIIEQARELLNFVTLLR